MAEENNYGQLQKFSLKTKKLVHKWNAKSERYIMSMTSSYDSKL